MRGTIEVIAIRPPTKFHTRHQDVKFVLEQNPMVSKEWLLATDIDLEAQAEDEMRVREDKAYGFREFRIEATERVPRPGHLFLPANYVYHLNEFDQKPYQDAKPNTLLDQALKALKNLGTNARKEETITHAFEIMSEEMKCIAGQNEIFTKQMDQLLAQQKDLEQRTKFLEESTEIDLSLEGLDENSPQD